jgi:hypothetical protein
MADEALSDRQQQCLRVINMYPPEEERPGGATKRNQPWSAGAVGN